MVITTRLQQDIRSLVRVIPLDGDFFFGDSNANRIEVEIFDNGQPASLSGAVKGYVIRSDNVTVPIDGTLTGNVASVLLPASVYTEVGLVSLVVKVGNTTVGACTTYVYRSETGEIVDPGSVVPSLSELLAKIADCEAATADANAAAEAAEQALEDLEDTLAAKADIAYVDDALYGKEDVLYKEILNQGHVIFTDGAEGAPLKEARTSFGPTQKGSGTPSSSNIRTIYGRNTVDFVCSGKNQLPLNATSGTNGGITYTVNSDGSITLNGTSDSSYGATIPLYSGSENIPTPGTSLYAKGLGDRPSNRFTLSSTVQGILPENPSVMAMFFGAAWANSTDGGIGVVYNSIPQRVKTLSTWSISLDVKRNTTLDNLTIRPMLVLSQDTDDEYEPYKGYKYTVKLPESLGDIYGCELVLHRNGSATMNVTHALIASYNGETLPGAWLSDRDVYAAGATPSTGAQVVYELAEPITYELVASNVATLPYGYRIVYEIAGSQTYDLDIPLIRTYGGYNHLASPVGNLSVIYQSDRFDTIDKQKADRKDTVLDTTLSHGRKDGTSAGDSSIAYGSDTEASGPNSVAFGSGTTANHKDQFVFGRNNVPDPSQLYPNYAGTYAEIVGNGRLGPIPSLNTQSNARTLDWNGNERLKGDLLIDCNPDSSGGTSVRQVITRSGVATLISGNQYRLAL